MSDRTGCNGLPDYAIITWLADAERVTAMKKEIHPPYYKTVVRCACGAAFETGSTKENLRVEICSQCHPLFTGQQKIIDTCGRVERFTRRFGLK